MKKGLPRVFSCTTTARAADTSGSHLRKFEMMRFTSIPSRGESFRVRTAVSFFRISSRVSMKGWCGPTSLSR